MPKEALNIIKVKKTPVFSVGSWAQSIKSYLNSILSNSRFYQLIRKVFEYIDSTTWSLLQWGITGGLFFIFEDTIYWREGLETGYIMVGLLQ